MVLAPYACDKRIMQKVTAPLTYAPLTHAQKYADFSPSY